MKRLIECVPNFSEGRDTAKVDAIVASMSGVAGVYVLDRESDADHNRSVVTLAGDPEAVAEAVLLGVGKAMELIDLTTHTGAHPRVGRGRESDPIEPARDLRAHIGDAIELGVKFKVLARGEVRKQCIVTE